MLYILSLFTNKIHHTMAYIKIIDTTKLVSESVISAWVITKSNNDRIFVVTDNPFKNLFNNGYIDITDIFDRKILLNTQLCIEMVEMPLTKIVFEDKVEYYEGELEIRKGYSVSDDVAKPLSIKNTTKICG